MTCWILLRGLTRESGHWGDFPAQLAAALPGSTIYAPDLPGNGELHGDASSSRVREMTNRLRAQISRHGLPPPYHLLAMSLGAMVAVDWASSQAQEVAAGVLINTSMRPFSPFFRRLRPRNYLPLLRLACRQDAAEQCERDILRLTSCLGSPHLPTDTETSRRETIIAHWTALRRRHPVSTVNAWRQLLAAARYRAPRQAPAVPLLILGSRHDALVNPSCSRAVALRWQTAYAEHPTAGHDLPLDDARWVLSQIGDWLRTIEVVP